MPRPTTALVAFALALLICSASAGRASVVFSDQVKPLSGTLTDPQGDVTPSAQVRVPPDFVAATIDVRDGHLTLTISFAPGTLSPQTAITVYLDTDENASTGQSTFKGDRQPIGADYVIRSLQPHDPARAALSDETAFLQSRFSGLVAVTSPAPDTRRIELPLSRLGNDDGRMKFKLECSQVVSLAETSQGSTQTTVLADVMPNMGGKPGVVK
jgi:hypothetical protein